MALILWVQGAALADAAAHGEAPHKHYGVSCELHAVATEVAPLPASPALPIPTRTLIPAEQPILQAYAWVQPPARGPPPRAPPLRDQ